MCVQEFDSLEKLKEKVDILCEMLSACKHAVVHTGAGISTAAGEMKALKQSFCVCLHWVWVCMCFGSLLNFFLLLQNSISVFARGLVDALKFSYC